MTYSFNPLPPQRRLYGGCTKRHAPPSLCGLHGTPPSAKCGDTSSHVIVAQPMTDLCWTCQQNSTAIVCSAGPTEAGKSEVGVYSAKHAYSAYT